MLLQLSDTALSLRPITEEDAPLLSAIYASTRETEMQRVVGWTAEQKEAFLFQQFTAQHVYYQQVYKDGFFWIIEKGKEPIGRLYLAPAFLDGSIRIVDITLLPSYRNNGFGRSILTDIMSLAVAMQKSITIHVESFNPARRLYERLGFMLKDRKNEVYHLLEWKPGSA